MYEVRYSSSVRFANVCFILLCGATLQGCDAGPHQCAELVIKHGLFSTTPEGEVASVDCDPDFEAIRWAKKIRCIEASRTCIFSNCRLTFEFRKIDPEPREFGGRTENVSHPKKDDRRLHVHAHHGGTGWANPGSTSAESAPSDHDSGQHGGTGWASSDRDWTDDVCVASRASSAHVDTDSKFDASATSMSSGTTTFAALQYRLASSLLSLISVVLLVSCLILMFTSFSRRRCVTPDYLDTTPLE
eukprot:TRINITY_DN28360_c0_g1_i1.p1 TRINITY_DN28360_c0_g1~~TRINITY_DN28360_c0_g1_i1.p1  ORF type:complete len:245 (-),score=13.67 TRINITY_DN28360_c0_g1_i1:175-909(-)